MDDEAIARIRRRFATNQEAVSRILDRQRLDPDVLARIGGSVQLDPEVLDRLAGRVQLDPVALQRLAGRFQLDPALLERIGGRFQLDPAILRRVAGDFRPDPAALERLARALGTNTLDYAALEVTRAEIQRLNQNQEELAEALDADILSVEAATGGTRGDSASELVELYESLSAADRRRLRDRLLAVVVSLVVYIDRLAVQQGRQAAFALAALLLTHLFLYSAVLDALDTLEEEEADLS